MKTFIITCWALCMFLEGELVEHTYQSSMSECLKNKRVASRTIQQSERVQFACGKIKAEVEYIKEEGQTAGRTRILKVIDSGYKEDKYGQKY